MATIKLILADDHHPVRQGFRALLESLEFVEIVGEAANGQLNTKDIIHRAVEKGVKGFLFKNTSKSELSETIRKVAQGDIYFSSEVAAVLVHSSHSPANALFEQLSQRELEILKLIAEGYSSPEIGEKLFISPRTVDIHRNNLIQKFNVNGIVGLVRFALQHKLV
ncbi:response regulator transcription factor [Runella sp.]|uniref:response regulator transcription factor n=1 Tax=Runella sp. TaxID=1960881 RepID=UPI003D115261